MKDYFKEKRILAKINCGDEDTFLKVYDFYAPKLFRHAYYRLKSKETAEDITQQVFYKTWQYLTDAKNKIDNLNAFLYRLTNNLITDYYRLAERKNITLDDNLERTLPAETSSANDEMDRKLEIITVKKVITQLSSHQQELITWRYLDDLTINQIAKITGQSKNSIYVSLHRAKKELKTILKYEIE